jgi:hypothetical protein
LSEHDHIIFSQYVCELRDLVERCLLIFNDRGERHHYALFSSLMECSPPYTIFLLNDDMKLNRNRQFLI